MQKSPIHPITFGEGWACVMSETTWALGVGAVPALVGLGVAALAVPSHPDRAKAAKMFFFLAACVFAWATVYWTTGHALLVRIGVDLAAASIIIAGLLAGSRFADRSALSDLGLPSSAFLPQPLWPQDKRLASIVLIGVLMFIALVNAVQTNEFMARIFILWEIPWRWILPTALVTFALATIINLKRERQSPTKEPGGDPETERLRGIAKSDKDRIKDLVRIPWVSYRPNFKKDGPYLDFLFCVFNNSIYDILIANSIEKGELWCEPDTEDLHYAPKIKADKPIRCRSRSGSHFVIRQALRLEEISRFEGKNQIVGFGSLVINFTGTEEFPEIGLTRLETNHYLETNKGAWPNPSQTEEFAFLYSDEQWALLASSNKQEVAALRAEIASLKSQLEEAKKPSMAQKAGDKPKGEPQITGKMNEVYFHMSEDRQTCRVVMNIHIENDGRPTKIQEFELQFLFDHNLVHNDPVSCLPFQVRRPSRSGNDSEVVQDLLDLRDLNKTPFERHFPRDGWLCFEISTGDRLDLDNDYAQRLVRLQLFVKDGANGRHPIVQVYPFPENGKLEKIN